MLIQHEKKAVESAEEIGDMLARVVKQTLAAEAKHPLWPDTLFEGRTSAVHFNLTVSRLTNDADGGNKATARSVIAEEIYESYEALLAGDANKAREEIVHTMAVLVRLYLNADYYAGKARS